MISGKRNYTFQVIISFDISRVHEHTIMMFWHSVFITLHPATTADRPLRPNCTVWVMAYLGVPFGRQRLVALPRRPARVRCRSITGNIQRLVSGAVKLQPVPYVRIYRRP